MASFLSTSCIILFFLLKLMKERSFKHSELQKPLLWCGKWMGVSGKRGRAKMFSINGQVGFKVASESSVKLDRVRGPCSLSQRWVYSKQHPRRIIFALLWAFSILYKYSLMPWHLLTSHFLFLSRSRSLSFWQRGISEAWQCQDSLFKRHLPVIHPLEMSRKSAF